MKNIVPWILLYYITISNSANVDPNCTTFRDLCFPCRSGTYANASLSPFCNCCDSGNCPLEGCSPCQQGYYQPKEEASNCLPCPKGSYADVTGSTVCFLCEKGSYSNTIGSKTCLPCPPGSYGPDRNATNCTYCSSGTFQAKSGSNLCSKCDVGTVCSKTGCVNCDPCDAGKEAKNFGSEHCSMCEIGYYKPKKGSNLCSACNAGLFSHLAGSLYCDPCPENFYCPCPACIPIACPLGSICPPGSKQPSFCNGSLYMYDGNKCRPTQQLIAIVVGSAIAAVLLLTFFGVQCFKRMQSRSQHIYSPLPKNSEPFYTGL